MNNLKKQGKHDHHLTDILKVGIFSLVMLMPFAAVCSEVLYVSNNKNAKDSYYAENINEITYEPVETITIHTEYQWYTNNLILDESLTFNTEETQVSNISNVYTGNTQYDSWLNDTISFLFYKSANQQAQLRVRTSDNTVHYLGTNVLQIRFNFEYETLPINQQYIKPYITKVVYNEDTYLNNVFYTATKQVTNSDLFGWTKETGIYSAINGMCIGLDIQNNFIAVCISYWALITCIYIIIDIVMKCFTTITHIFTGGN